MCRQSLEIILLMLDSVNHTSSSAAGTGAWEFQVRLHGLRLTPLKRLCSQYIYRAARAQDWPSERTPRVQLLAAATLQGAPSLNNVALHQSHSRVRLASFLLALE